MSHLLPLLWHLRQWFCFLELQVLQASLLPPGSKLPLSGPCLMVLVSLLPPTATPVLAVAMGYYRCTYFYNL